MAGLGEVCSHIAAVLFYLETSSRVNGSSVCTQQKCQWVIPQFQKEIPYAPVQELDFTSAQAKRKKIDEAIQDENEVPNTNQASASSDVHQHDLDFCSRPTELELKSFFDKISRCKSKPAILSLIPDYQDRYISKSSLPSFPVCLNDLYDPSLALANYSDLLQRSESVQVEVNEEMVRNVEEATRKQSKSRLWYRYRAGRVTASKMKRACTTSEEMPSQRLIMEMCYPEAFGFTSKATRWGCEHESAACQRYFEQMKDQHSDFTMSSSGLVLNPRWPHLGASPDGIVNCSCCGRGVLEVKCPYSHRYNTVHDIARDSSSCLQISETDVSPHLDHDHAYYYQVQAQIFLCQVEYSDFCVCTFPQGSLPEIHIERIFPDPELWQTCIYKSTKLFRNSLLPELLGKWNSRGPSLPVVSPANQLSTSQDQPTTSQDQPATSQDQPATSQDQPATSQNQLASSEDERLFCYCQREGGQMIGCDNSNCPIEWFHMKCLKIKNVPKGKWYCPDCRRK